MATQAFFTTWGTHRWWWIRHCLGFLSQGHPCLPVGSWAVKAGCLGKK